MQVRGATLQHAKLRSGSRSVWRVRESRCMMRLRRWSVSRRAVPAMVQGGVRCIWRRHMDMAVARYNIQDL